MSHCRFENTAQDLSECVHWLSENEISQLSPGELTAFKRLVQKAWLLVQDYSEDALGFEV